MASKDGDNGRRKREIAAVAHRAALQGQLPAEEVDRTMRALGRAGRRTLQAIMRMLSGPEPVASKKKDTRPDAWWEWRNRWTKQDAARRVGRARPGGTRAHPTAISINLRHFATAQQRADRRRA